MAEASKPPLKESAHTSSDNSSLLSGWFSGSGKSNSSSSSTSTSEPLDAPRLKAIKTPHEDPISHPELSFTPSDIGIWEINKEKPVVKSTPTAEEAKKQGRTFGFW